MSSHQPDGIAAGARIAVITLIGVMTALFLLPVAAAAQDDPATRLLLRPVDQPGTYFDLEIPAGEARTLEVELGNDGTQAVSARTYAADVYTIVNGGFGGRLRDQPQTGMTRWVDYSTEVLRLGPDDATRRSFTVTVPRRTEPGEYIAGLILENEAPIPAADGLGFDQVVRQAVAIVVTVPGRRVPGLEIGNATHRVVVGTSVVRVAVQNTGNVRLRPLVAFTLRGPAGTEVSRATLQMDSFYARTGTFAEFPLASLLLPGTYTVDLALDDARDDAHAEREGLTFLVLAPVADPAGADMIGGLIDVLQGEAAAPPVVLAMAVVCSLILVAVIAAFVARRHRHRRPGAS